jgi:hypothetical protein
VELRAVGEREAHVGEHLGLVHKLSEFLDARAELVGDLAPLSAGGVGVVLGEGDDDEGRDSPPPCLPACIRETEVEVALSTASMFAGVFYAAARTTQARGTAATRLRDEEPDDYRDGGLLH